MILFSRAISEKALHSNVPSENQTDMEIEFDVHRRHGKLETAEPE